MPTLVRRSGRLLLLLALAVAAVPAAGGVGTAPAAAPPKAAASAADEVLGLLNAARADHGAPPLSRDRRLARAARRHSRDMVEHHYFAHESRTGEPFSARIAREGWMEGRRGWQVGENLAWGSAGPRAEPPSIVAAWLRSPRHREVLLDPAYRVVGVGIAQGTPNAGMRGGRTYTADFGS
jgi:uncharacterized protein YkwD